MYGFSYKHLQQTHLSWKDKISQYSNLTTVLETTINNDKKKTEIQIKIRLIKILIKFPGL